MPPHIIAGGREKGLSSGEKGFWSSQMWQRELSGFVCCLQVGAGGSEEVGGCCSM